MSIFRKWGAGLVPGIRRNTCQISPMLPYSSCTAHVVCCRCCFPDAMNHPPKRLLLTNNPLPIKHRSSSRSSSSVGVVTHFMRSTSRLFRKLKPREAHSVWRRCVNTCRPKFLTILFCTCSVGGGRVLRTRGRELQARG